MRQLLSRTTTPWGEHVVVHPQAREADIRTALVAARVQLQPRVGGDGYLVDRHFERYVLASLTTLDDVRRFLDALDLGAKRRNGFSGECAKARSARSSMAYSHGPWITPAEWARASLARARRVYCACHETCCFHPRH